MEKQQATLRYTNGQYLLTVDERPEHGQYIIMPRTSAIVRMIGNNFPCCECIIAAENLKGVTKIKFEFFNLPIMFKEYETNKHEYLEQYLNTEVSYSLINNEAVIKL